MPLINHAPNTILKTIVELGGFRARDWINEQLSDGRKVYVHGYHKNVIIDG